MNTPPALSYATSTNFRQARGRPSSRWKDLVRQDLQLINLALEDVPKLCQNRERWSDKMDPVGTNPTWHYIWQQLQEELKLQDKEILNCIYIYTSRKGRIPGGHKY